MFISNTLSDNDAYWTNSTVIRGDVAGQVSRLKEQVAADILVSEALNSSTLWFG